MRSRANGFFAPVLEVWNRDLIGRQARIVAVAAIAILVAALAGCSESSDPVEPPAADVCATTCSDEAGNICTWAGNGAESFNGDGKCLLGSSFYWPIDLTYHQGTFYILDWNNHIVRKVTPEGTLQTVFGTAFVGDGPANPFEVDLEYVAPGYPALEINLNHPTHLLPMPDGSLLVTCWHNHKLRRLDLTAGKALVTCGSFPGYAGDGGAMAAARLNQPTQTTMATDGALFVLDMRNQRIRRIATDQTITTVVGTGTRGYNGDGIAPTDAQLNLPFGSNPQPGGAVLFDEQGRLYISDTLNNRIRRVDFTANLIETFAGTGTAGFAGDGGQATAAQISNPRDLLFHDGKLYFADEGNHRIRVIDMATGVISTFAGDGEARFAGDGGPAVQASLNRPAGLEFADGFIYIADTLNGRIRRVRL